MISRMIRDTKLMESTDLQTKELIKIVLLMLPQT